jgi:hypothetical protein
MCRIIGEAIVAANLDLNDSVIEEAKELGGHATKKAAVSAALDEYVARRKQGRIVELFGTIDYDPGYDYKELRRSKPLHDSF